MVSSASEVSDSDADMLADETSTPGNDTGKKARSIEETVANGKQEESDCTKGVNSEEANASSTEDDNVLSKDETKETDELKSSRLLKFSLADANEKNDEASTKDKNGEEKKKKKEKKEKKKRRLLSSDSDFESSDEEIGTKKKRKKKKASSSEDDAEEAEDAEEAGQPKPKRRRRIKKADTSDDENDSDIQILNESQRSTENGGKGRKNIKKIMKDKNLKVR